MESQPKINLGAAFSSAWEIYTKGLGPYIGFFIVAFLISVIINFIPFVSFLFSIAVSPILTMGIGFIADKYRKKGIADFGAGFDGFKNYGNVLLSRWVVNILSTLAFMAVFMPFIFGSLPEIVDILVEVSETTNPQEQSFLIEDFFYIFTSYIPAFILASFVTLIIYNSVMFFAYYGAFSPDGLSNGFSKAWKAGWGNMHILILFGIISIVMAMIAGFMLFIPLLFVLPYLEVVTYEMYRQLDPIVDSSEENFLDELTD